MVGDLDHRLVADAQRAGFDTHPRIPVAAGRVGKQHDLDAGENLEVFAHHALAGCLRGVDVKYEIGRKSDDSIAKFDKKLDAHHL